MDKKWWLWIAGLIGLHLFQVVFFNYQVTSGFQTFYILVVPTYLDLVLALVFAVIVIVHLVRQKRDSRSSGE